MNQSRQGGGDAAAGVGVGTALPDAISIAAARDASLRIGHPCDALPAAPLGRVRASSVDRQPATTGPTHTAATVLTRHAACSMLVPLRMDERYHASGQARRAPRSGRSGVREVLRRIRMSRAAAHGVGCARATGYRRRWPSTASTVSRCPARVTVTFTASPGL